MIKLISSAAFAIALSTPLYAKTAELAKGRYQLVGISGSKETACNQSIEVMSEKDALTLKLPSKSIVWNYELDGCFTNKEIMKRECQSFNQNKFSKSVSSSFSFIGIITEVYYLEIYQDNRSFNFTMTTSYSPRIANELETSICHYQLQ